MLYAHNFCLPTYSLILQHLKQKNSVKLLNEYTYATYAQRAN